MNKSKITAFIAIFILMLLLVSCTNSLSVEENYDGIGEVIVDSTENSYGNIPNNYAEIPIPNIIGDFQYPENPAQDLRNALIDDVNERGLPLVISELENIEFNNTEYTQITINFTDSSNVAVILFSNRHDSDILLDVLPSPSFTMGFKDHDSPQDMIMVLTSIIRYLSPDLSIEETARLAAMQDQTISTDGFSMPLDIGGYQVQARYTNPFVFLHAPDFDARLGVTVRAIRQLWRGAIESTNAHLISGSDDYSLLGLSFWDAERHPKIIYGDFIVRNTVQNLCWRHGRTSVTVEVESMSGRQFLLNLDTWRYYEPYEFGIGQQYTLFLDLKFGYGIVYAIQNSESVDFNYRGQEQSIDTLSLDFIDSVRAWPEEDGTLVDVYFMTYAFGPLCIFTVLEGQRLGGDIVWPSDRYNPFRDDYTFHGWFDNPYFLGEPYTNETPIYQETRLYPKWIYTGPGGIRPRAERGIVHGIDESSLYAGQNLAITAYGYNMSLESPRDKRFRWMPVSWRLSDGSSGDFTNEMPFQADILLGGTGDQWLYITYLEEVFDRVSWQQTGQVREVRERLLTIGA